MKFFRLRISRPTALLHTEDGGKNWKTEIKVKMPENFPPQEAPVYWYGKYTMAGYCEKNSIELFTDCFILNSGEGRVRGTGGLYFKR